jgi:hypothetical protein
MERVTELAPAMREDHGFMVPGRSLLAPDVVEGQEKNEPREDT